MFAQDTLINPKIHPQIASALLTLSAVCDGANSTDQQGFNKVDRDFGHSLADVIRSGSALTKKQQTKALEMLQKYHRQIEGLPTPEELEEFLNPAERLELDKLTDGFWKVRNLSKGTEYDVVFDGDVLECSCPASAKCKHIRLVEESLIEPAEEPIAVNTSNIVPFPVTETVHDVEVEIVGDGEIPSFERSIDLIVTRNGVTLNHEQSNAVRTIIDWWHNPDEMWICIEGSAGSGKTTMVQEAIHRIKESSPHALICCTAPTNKAVKILEKTARSQKLYGVDFATIYQLLGMRLMVDDDGNEKVEPDPKGNIAIFNYKLIIVDEASMVNQKLWTMIIGHTRMDGPKVLFMGDPAQLPPIGESLSQAFQLEEKISLTQVMRYGGPILNLATEIRENLTRIRPIVVEQSTVKDKGVHVVDKYEWLDLLIEDFRSPRYKEDPDHCKALAWTNGTVNWLNKYCRLKLFGPDVPQFLQEERLIAIKPVILDGSVVMTTSSEAEILHAELQEHRGWQAWKLRLLTDQDKVVSVFALDQSELDRYTSELNDLWMEAKSLPKASYAAKPIWRQYFYLKEMFANVGNCYAITVHKSQGSTFRHTYVVYKDLLANKKVNERNRLCYVAFSRASENLFVMEPTP